MTCARDAWISSLTKNNAIDLSQQTPDQPNSPAWGRNVRIFDASSSENVESTIKDLLRNVTPLTDDKLDWRGGQNGHFSDERHALLFKPGTYDVEFEVGYYVQVLGLGAEPSDVSFSKRGPYVTALDQRPSGAGSLNTFWRSVENVKVEGDMTWAVSQAAPMRRVEVGGDLFLYDNTSVGSNFSSGGFIADVSVSGDTKPGSQQQFIFRNCSFAKECEQCAWSLVAVGCENAPPTGTTSQKDKSATLTYNEPKTQIVAEKPYVSTVPGPDGEDAYVLRVPRVKKNSVGVSFLQSDVEEDVIPFDYIYYADADVLVTGSVASAIQSHLDKGIAAVVFSPGIFELEHTLRIKHSNQILLGIGMTTLKPPNDGTPCIRVEPSATEGVRIAGVTLQASKLDSLVGSTLLEWGIWEPPSDSEITNPGILSDVFARAGGPDAVDRELVGVDVMIRINSRGVVGDNLWLWRADHSALAPGEAPLSTEAFHLVVSGEFPAHTSLEVFGDDVIVYGLACEHTIRNITRWHGERGTVLFYQCELPYDVAQSTFNDFAGYVVEDDVEEHRACGVGVYSFFRDYQVVVKSGVKANASKKHNFSNTFTRYLDDAKGHFGIKNVINSHGGASWTADDSKGLTGVFPFIASWP